MTATVTTLTKRCPGFAKHGIPAHEAPLSAFGKHASQADGLQPICRADWTTYERMRREAAKAAKDASDPAGRTAAKATPAPAPVSIEEARTRRTKTTVSLPADILEEPATDGTPAQADEHAALEAAVAAVGGPGTRAGQDLLEKAAADAKAARRAQWADAKRRQRAAAKAAKEAQA